ncbi:MAG: carboxypeptidase regulatory-like domain-containing protein [Pleurocapsa sp.]
MFSVNMNKWYLLFSLAILPTLPEPALAHGAKIQYRQTPAITIQANYDDGSPMKNAQVVVYAPSDPAAPWIKGTTDETGHFSFTPDSSITGNWDVKVRQSGHGDIITIPLTDGKLNSELNTTKAISGNNSDTSLQKIIAAAAGIWGFVGTALFFSRPKSSN